jgi:hypothetical protein
MNKFQRFYFDLMSDFSRVDLTLYKNILLIVLVLSLSVFLGNRMTVFPKFFTVVLTCAAVVFIYGRWGPFGFVCCLVAFATLDFDGFNINQIPLLSVLFPDAGSRIRIVILVGSLYIFLFLIQSIRSNNQRHFYPYLLLLLIGVGGALTAFVFALQINIYGSNWYVRYILYGLILFALVYQIVKKPQQAKIVLICLLISGIFFAVIAKILPSSIVQFDNNVNNGLSMADNRLAGIWYLPLGFRISANPIFISTYLSFSSILAWGMFLFTKRNLEKLILLVAIGLMTYVNLTTISRTGLYGLFIGVVFVTFVYVSKVNRRAKVKVFISLFSLVCVIAVAFSVFVNTNSDPLLVNRLWGIEENRQIREDLISQSLYLSLQHPFGEGPGALQVFAGLPHHSLFTMLLSGLGWFGFLALVILVFWCIKPLAKFNLKDPTIFEMQVSLLGALLAVFVMGLGHSYLDTTWGSTLFWSSLGLAATFHKFPKNYIATSPSF